MSNYEYKGCVTGFSESDAVTVWQPTENPYPVQHDDNEYANRLVDVGLLVQDAILPTNAFVSLFNVPLGTQEAPYGFYLTINGVTYNPTHYADYGLVEVVNSSALTYLYPTTTQPVTVVLTYVNPSNTVERLHEGDALYDDDKHTMSFILQAFNPPDA